VPHFFFSWWLARLRHGIRHGDLSGIPDQRRIGMKISLELSGPHGKMYENVSTYWNLPEIYAWEIAAKAIALANYIEHLVGQASDPEATYAVAFHVVVDGKEPKLPEGVKGQVKQDRLLYSQAAEIQAIGIKMLADLQEGADMEIKSGQRT
jgi:hypothetical protein